MKKRNETPYERRLRYLRSTREKADFQRKERNRAKQTGEMHLRNLAFLSEIMNRLGLNQKKLAFPLGWTAQNVNYHFMSDDMQYSDIQKALGYYGFRIDAVLEYSRTIRTSSPQYRIIGNVGHFDSVVRYPDYLLNAIYRNSRIAFVCTAIVETHRTFGSICREAGIDPSSIRYYFKRDDIRVRHLYLLATVLGAVVVWRVSKT